MRVNKRNEENRRGQETNERKGCKYQRKSKEQVQRVKALQNN
jgi:hypothetical protein